MAGNQFRTISDFAIRRIRSYDSAAATLTHPSQSHGSHDCAGRKSAGLAVERRELLITRVPAFDTRPEGARVTGVPLRRRVFPIRVGERFTVLLGIRSSCHGLEAWEPINSAC